MKADVYPMGIATGISAGLGEDSEKRIKDDAQKNVMYGEGLTTLTTMLEKYRAFFHTKLGSDASAKFSALVFYKVVNAMLYGSLQRRYYLLHRELIIGVISELEEVGAIYKNPSAR